MKWWQPIQNFKGDDQLWAKETISVSQVEPSWEFAAPEIKHPWSGGEYSPKRDLIH